MSIQAPDTPMMRQYLGLKKECPDAILFFRLGDFYEMFLDDAILASKELNLTLTGRGKDENRIAMCGIPYHAAEGYISKLLAKGYKVAIGEQTEAADAEKGITKREIVKIVTPGTMIEHGILNETENNYLVGICKHKHRTGIALLDISTGAFNLCITKSETQTQAILTQLNAKEVIIPDELKHLELPRHILKNYLPFHNSERAGENLAQFFKLDHIKGLGIDIAHYAFPAAWAILDYALKTQKQDLLQIKKPSILNLTDTVFMDGATLKNLELVDSLNAQSDSTLYSVIHFCKTAMGSRKLKDWLLNPSAKLKTIQWRQTAVSELVNDIVSREEIRDVLTQVYDLERLISRIISSKKNPRDLLALQSSLSSLDTLPDTLKQLGGDYFHHLSDLFITLSSPKHPTQYIRHLIERAIHPETPPSIREGNIFKAGFSDELDSLTASFKEIKEWIASLEEKERTHSGIKTLKVGYNKVFGYYFEVTKSNAQHVPENYIRKQTLVNGERYITPELKEKENILLHGEDKQRSIETSIYIDLISDITPHLHHLQELAEHLAGLDCIQSLATAAAKYQFQKPTLINDGSLRLHFENGRHPVIERQQQKPFVKNSVSMKKDNNQFILITGPNMAGKSTIMRQVALITILAQMGSYVPAENCIIDIIDQLHTRIGALDNLYAGQSTFMVEMLETAAIINTATEKSLIILDEIGRGTATFDGMSLACAISEHIHQEIKARTLFATHYHELTILERQLTGFSNYSMKISEEDGQLIFTYKLISGPADKSYGIHVGKMAGLPPTVIANASKHLKGFEFHGADYLRQRFAQQMDLFSA